MSHIQKPILYESRNVDWVVAYSNLEFGKKIGTEDFKSDEFNVYIIIKMTDFNFLKIFRYKDRE